MNSINTLKECANKIKELCLFDDILFQKVAESVVAMQELIRTIMNDNNIVIKSVTPQRTLGEIIGRAVRLDVLCVDENRIHYNIEVQNKKVDNDAKRVFYNRANIVTSVTEKGDRFEKIPDTVVIYISDYDVFKHGKSKYVTHTKLDDGNELVNDGCTSVYINSVGTGYPDIQELMAYFKDRSGQKNNKFKELSMMVNYYKNTQKGKITMSEWIKEHFAEELAEGKTKAEAEGIAEGIAEEKKRTVKEMLKDNLSFELMMRYSKLDKNELTNLIDEISNENTNKTTVI